MAGGLGAASFGAGFGQALTDVLLGHRKQQQEREDKDFQAILPIKLQLAADSGDYSGVEQLITAHNPKLAATLKKNSPFANLHQMIGPQLKMSAEQPGMSNAAPDAADASQPQSGMFGLALPPAEPAPPGSGLPAAGAPPPALAPLLSRTINTTPLPNTSAPTGPTFFGSPVQTPEQRQARQNAAETGHEEAMFQGKVNIARKLFAQGTYSTMADALAAVGMQPRAGAGAESQSVAGEAPDAKGVYHPAFGVFNRAQQKYLDPDTQKPIEGFRPRTATASSSLGQYVEQAARVLNFPNANAAAQAGQMDAVEAKARELAQAQAGATTTGRTEAEAKAPLSTQGKYNLLLKLQEDWNKVNQPQREMERQFQLMQTGLSRADADPIGGSQAVLVTFQKILDPSSVVRESEYARSPEGLGLVDRLQGLYDRYSKGGAGVPTPVLKEMVETARQFMAGQQDWNALVKDSISGTAKDAGLNPDRVFGVAAASANPAGKPEAAGATTAGAPGKPYKDANGNWIIP